MASCVIDLDCPGSQVCYTNISWYNNSGNGCLCSSWYGWTGADCTERTPTGYFWLVSAILISIACFLCAIVAVSNGVRLFRAGRFSLLRDSTTTANWQLVLGFLFEGVSEVLVGLDALHADTSNMTSVYGDKVTVYQPVHSIVFAIASCMAIVAGMTIALVWVEVAERANRLANNSPKTVIPKTRSAVIAFEIIVAATMIGSALAGATNISMITGMIVMLVLIFTYMFGFCRLRLEMFRTASAVASTRHKEVYKRVIAEIRWTMSGVLLGITLMFVFGVLILFANLTTWKEYCKPDEIPGLIVIWQLFIVAMLFGEAFMLSALRKATARRINQLKTSSDPSGNNAARIAASADAKDVKPPRGSFDASIGAQKSTLELATPRGAGNGSQRSFTDTFGGNDSQESAKTGEALVAHQPDAAES